jgi:hypothetical protein
MLQAREEFDKAYEKYQRVLAVAMAADAGVASDHALRWEGRAYATALRRYSDATMAWLICVENSLSSPRRGLER